MAPKRISKARIIQQFVKLPEEKRVELLSKNLSPDVIASYASDAFYQPMIALRDKPEREAKAFLKEKFGDTQEHLKQAIKCGEGYLTSMKEGEYLRFGARTDEEKLYALVCGETMTNRLRAYYDALYEKDKQPYIRKALAQMNNAEGVSKLLADPRNYAPGKTPDDFAKDMMNTVDLSKEPSLMEEVRSNIPANDPRQKDKLQSVAQKYMLFDEGSLDPKDLGAKLQKKGWKKDFDIQKDLEDLNTSGFFQAEHLQRRVKSAMEIPETEEEKAVFKEAGLQVCRDYINFKEFSRKDYKDLGQDEKDFLKYTNDLQEDLAKEGMKRKDVQDLRESLAGEYNTLAKTKTGWFLSSTNSPEYNEMMKHLKLFNAKLDLINGKLIFIIFNNIFLELNKFFFIILI